MNLKLLIRLSFGSLVVLIAIGLLFATEYAIKKAFFPSSIANLEIELFHANERLKRDLDRTKELLLSFSELPPVPGIIRAVQHGGFDEQENSTYQMWKTRLETIWSEHVKNNHDLLQVRYIDAATGKELVRVNLNDNKPEGFEIVKDEDLQIKADKDYFKAGLTMGKGEVFVSRFNLNQEYGRVEIPHTATARFVTPVFDDQGNIFGLVIINQNINRALRNFYDETINNVQVMLYDNYGDFIIHPDSEFEFGGDLGKPGLVTSELSRMGYDDPDLGSSGIAKGKDASKVFFARQEFEAFPGYKLSSIMYEDYAVAEESLSEVRNWIVVVSTILTVFAIIVSLVLSNQVTRPISKLVESIKKSDNLQSLKFEPTRITDVQQVQDTLTEYRDQLLAADSELEAALKKQVVAESHAEAKSKFLAHMSHEIRTPMNAIIGLSNLALKTELSPKQYNYVSNIHNSGKALLSIINDILDFSKIEAGKLEIESIPFDLESVFLNLSNVVTYKAHEKNLELALGIDSQIPVSLIGDPLRLGQVLINIVNNSVKFTKEGEIVVYAKVEEETEEDLVALFWVKDTGIGIPPEKVDRLFRSFSQMDNSTTREYGGTGLGLAICEQLVSLMGGKIWVESEVGVGTTFYFTIRFRKGKEQGKRAYKPVADLRGLRVLVCDDNKSAQCIIKGILESFTFQVETVSSGEDALKVLETKKEEPIQLLVIDWKMPGFDGIQTIQAIQDSKKIESGIPIVLLTAYGKDELFEKAESLELDSILVKPATYSSMFNAVMEALHRDEMKLKTYERSKKGSNRKFVKAQGVRVLLVEDNELNQQVASELIESMGCVVEIAANGKEAVEKVSASSGRYGIIFMDIQMPVMDGYAATREIRKKQVLDSLPIVAMTADAVSGVRERCLEVGMNDFISKPLDPDKIFDLLERYLRRSHQNSQELTEPRPRPRNDQVTIPNLATVDIRDGLRRLNGNKSAYLKLLIRFSENYRDFREKVHEAFDSDDFESAFRLVHSLKGVSGNIGAKQLYEETVILEKEVKKASHQPEQVAALLEAFDGTLLPVLEEIANIRKPDQEPRPRSYRKPSLPTKAFSALLQELKNELEEGDIEARETLGKLIRSPESDANKEEWATLIKTVENYEFDTALEQLEHLNETLS